MNRSEEKGIEREILAWLHFNKFQCWKNNNGATVIKEIGRPNRFFRSFMDWRGQTFCGMPDISGYIPPHLKKPGAALFIEVKKVGGKISEHQKNFIQNAKSSGCVAFIAHSVDEVKIELSKAGVL